MTYSLRRILLLILKIFRALQTCNLGLAKSLKTMSIRLYSNIFVMSCFSKSFYKLELAGFPTQISIVYEYV